MFLWHSHLLCWGFASLVHLVCHVVCFTYLHYSPLCLFSAALFADYISATLLGRVLLPELQCVALYSTV